MSAFMSLSNLLSISSRTNALSMTAILSPHDFGAPKIKICHYFHTFLSYFTDMPKMVMILSKNILKMLVIFYCNFKNAKIL